LDGRRVSCGIRIDRNPSTGTIVNAEFQRFSGSISFAAAQHSVVRHDPFPQRQRYRRTRRRGCTAAPYAPGAIVSLRHGTIAVHGKGSLLDLLLLCQPDRYGRLGSELTPVANPDVESQWGAALGAALNAGDADSGFHFPTPQDDDGAPLPYAPLFYCSHQAVFCHPLCPSCGGPLDQCRDDAVLGDAGLSPFSTSLNRYLHCPACTAAGAAPIFYSLEKPDDTPDCLHGCSALIEGFSALLIKPDFGEQLPCIQCKEAALCYGPEIKALERMRPFQFYPFFMMVQPAPTLNALDFLALLSGATPEAVMAAISGEAAADRLKWFKRLLSRVTAGSGLLFGADARRFLEVLYLKLTFLQDLIALSRRSNAVVGDRMTLEAFGVRLSSRGGHLPYLWDFDVEQVDRVGRPSRKLATGSETERFREFLGFAWHYVLLANGAQQMDRIGPALEQRLMPSAESGAPAVVNAIDDPVFGAHHLFWNADPLPVPEAWQGFWFRALDLGADLLCGTNRELLETGGGFDNDLEILKEEIHAVLFTATAPCSETVEPVEQEHDSTIGKILGSILNRYEQTNAEAIPDDGVTEESQETDPAGQLNEDGDYEETVILADDRRAEAHGHPPAPAPPRPASEPERRAALDGIADSERSPDLDRTVVIKAPTARNDAPDPDATVVIQPPAGPRDMHDPDATAAMKAPPAADAPEPDATVVIQPDRRVPEPPPQNDLEKTVVIGQGGAVPQPPETAPEVPATPAPAAGDDLDKTVVIRPAGAAPQPPEAAPAGRPPLQPAPEEDLDKTVVIGSPQASRTSNAPAAKEASPNVHRRKLHRPMMMTLTQR
jgi:hypothetical protein